MSTELPEPGEVADPDLGVKLDEDVPLPFDDQQRGDREQEGPADDEDDDDGEEDLLGDDEDEENEVTEDG